MTTSAETTTPSAPPERDHIHAWFGLTYSSYLVLHRTLLQSMPDEWQERFVGMLKELNAAYAHIEQAQAYKVDAANEREVSELDEATLQALGISRHEEDCTVVHDHEENFGVDCNDRVTYESFERADMERADRVLIPCREPIPHYNRGRTYIQPLPRSE